MNARFATAGLGLVMLLSGVPILAEQPATPLYTNADLKQLGPLDLLPESTVETEEADWDFITDFLERSFARIDAERDRDLARAALDAHEVRRQRVGYRCDLCYGVARYPYSAHRHRDHRVDDDSSGRTAAIRPLHAGPSKAMRMRARAIGNSGTDAFPRRGR